MPSGLGGDLTLTIICETAFVFSETKKQVELKKKPIYCNQQQWKRKTETVSVNGFPKLDNSSNHLLGQLLVERVQNCQSGRSSWHEWFELNLSAYKSESSIARLRSKLSIAEMSDRIGCFTERCSAASPISQMRGLGLFTKRAKHSSRAKLCGVRARVGY